MTDVWRTSKEAKPLVLGFGGAYGSPSTRIQQLATTIKPFLAAFDDLQDISIDQGIIFERFPAIIQTRDECQDFDYDYQELRTGLRRFGKREYRSGSFELPYKLPRYVYTNDEVDSFEKRLNVHHHVMDTLLDDILLRFFMGVTSSKVTAHYDDTTALGPGEPPAVTGLGQRLPATSSITKRLYLEIKLLGSSLTNSLPQVPSNMINHETLKQTYESKIMNLRGALEARIRDHCLQDDTTAAVLLESIESQDNESILRYLGERRNQLSLILSKPPRLVVRRRIFSLDDYFSGLRRPAAEVHVTNKRGPDTPHDVRTIDVVSDVDNRTKRFVVCTNLEMDIGIVHHLPSSIIYPFTKHKKVISREKVKKSRFGNNEVSFVEPNAVEIVGSEDRAPTEGIPKYLFEDISDMLSFEAAVRQKHIRHTLEIDTIRSRRGPEARAQNLKIWSDVDNGQVSMSFLSHENKLQTYFEFPITFFERTVTKPTKKSFKIDFKPEYKSVRAKKHNVGFRKIKSHLKRSDTSDSEGSASSKPSTSHGVLSSLISTTIGDMEHLIIDFSAIEDRNTFKEVFKTVYETLYPGEASTISSSSRSPDDAPSLASGQDIELSHPFNTTRPNNAPKKLPLSSATTSTTTIGSARNTTKPSSPSHSRSPFPAHKPGISRLDIDGTVAQPPLPLIEHLVPEQRRGNTFSEYSTPGEEFVGHEIWSGTASGSSNAKQLRRTHTAPHDAQDSKPKTDAYAVAGRGYLKLKETGAQPSKADSGAVVASQIWAHSSPTMFRVQGIPGSCIDGGTRHLLRAVLKLPATAEITTRSLAVSPDPAKLTAVVSFAAIPPQLSSAAFCESMEDKFPIPVPIAVDSDEDSVEALQWITIDTHFKNLTILRTVKASEEYSHTVDICAVSGLGAHAWGSFKEHRGQFMWLVDLLPKAFPGARIMTYGFDTKLKGNDSIQGLDDLGDYLRSDLEHLRQSLGSPPCAPLVFIAHSLGGLAVKEAMNSAKVRNLTDFVDSIQGVLFFGVPSEGMDIKSLWPIVEGQPNEDLVASLKPGSRVLRMQSQTFARNFDNYRTPPVAFFYENLPSKTARLDSEGDWKLDGPPTYLVTASSATCGVLGQHGGLCQSLQKSHTDLVKFSGPDDGEYKHVLPILTQIVNGART